MATSALVLINGVGRMTAITTSSLPAIYDESITVVDSGAVGNQINGPVTTGTSITLPSGQTYNSTELQVYLNGDRLESVFDYTYVGSIPRTQIQFTFDLEVYDRIDFVIERAF